LRKTGIEKSNFNSGENEWRDISARAAVQFQKSFKDF
jgi:hypothetical protein